MKRQKIKHFLIGLFLISSFGLGGVFAADIISEIISQQNATGAGSSNSQVTFSIAGTDTTDGKTAYINKGHDSAIIGNYFRGYYYDSVLGFFKTDWSADRNQNVRIVGSTSKCSSGYGYKLGGYAYSTTAGYIDFDYSDDVYVYYCISDQKLHGYSYSRHLGFQNFEGIGFKIVNTITTSNEVQTTQNTVDFFNDDTQITDPIQYVGSDSKITIRDINGDIIEIEADKESIFYIIK